MSTVVNGRRWYLYSAEFDSDDSKYGFYFYALSDEHASYRLEELKQTATLTGRILGILPA